MNVEDYVISKVHRVQDLENKERILEGAIRIACPTKFDGLIVIAALRGVPHRQIAEVVGLSPQAVSQRVDKFRTIARQQAAALFRD